MPSNSPVPPRTGLRSGKISLRSTASGGFALVISLVLMGFMLMLVLSLGSLVQTNVAGSAADLNLAMAQRNAVFGLSTAIGQLQQHAGIDQVATARADIKAGNLQNPMWTGVWDKDGNQITYLVSGNEKPGEYLKQKEDTVLSTARTNGNISENTAVVLASSGKTGTEVVAKLVEIEDGTNVGGYAYWVSDESTKAKINIVPGKQPTGSPSNFSLMTPQHFGFNSERSWFNQTDWFDGTATPDINALRDVKALVGLGTLYQLNNGADALMYDTTLYSYGVLSNSRTGGLKKDLTVGLGSTLDSSLAGNGIFAGDAPRWDQLHSWVKATPSGANSELEVQGANNTQAGIYPIVLGVQVYAIPAYDPTPVVAPPSTTADEYKLYSYIMPAVALWNPYNYPLESKDYKIVIGRIQRGTGPDYLGHFGGLNTDRTQGMSIREKLTVPAGGLNYEARNKDKHDPFRGVYNDNLSQHDQMLEFIIPAVSLAAGQVQIYTPASNDEYKSGTRNLVAGFNPRGFWIDMNNTLKKVSATDTSPLRKVVFNHNDSIPGRVGAFQFSIDGEDVLSEAVYLNHTGFTAGAGGTTVGNSVADVDVQPIPASFDDLVIDGTDPRDGTSPRGFGFLALRNMGIMTSSDFPHHREFDADFKWLAHYNPRAATSGPHPISYTASVADTNLSTTLNPSFISFSDHRGDAIHNLDYLKGEIEAKAGNGFILFEASPGIDNIFTVGQLTHAPLFYWKNDRSADLSAERVRERVENGTFDNLIPANPIGNSRANPAIPLDATERAMQYSVNTHGSTFQWPTETKLYDYSYLLNQVLWDEYFFSGVTTDNNSAEKPSRNPRIVKYPASNAVKLGLDSSAEHLLIDGPFNVNSTSESAWKALLTSFYGRTPNEPNKIDAPVLTDKTSPLTPFARVLPLPANAVSTDTNPSVTNSVAYAGYNTLSTEQIEALAKAIVEEIQLRGISPSLSAFVNRNLNPTQGTAAEKKEQQVQGILSAAIEKAQTNSANAINKNLRVSGQESSNWYDKISSRPDNVATEGYITEGLPGWLTSADILSRLGSVLTSRGDTFLIRSYGEYGKNNNFSKAWCEAVVQRTPEEFNPANKFGRRYVIVGFRWLNPDEI